MDWIIKKVFNFFYVSTEVEKAHINLTKNDSFNRPKTDEAILRELRENGNRTHLIFQLRNFSKTH